MIIKLKTHSLRHELAPRICHLERSTFYFRNSKLSSACVQSDRCRMYYCVPRNCHIPLVGINRLALFGNTLEFFLTNTELLKIHVQRLGTNLTTVSA